MGVKKHQVENAIMWQKGLKERYAGYADVEEACDAALEVLNMVLEMDEIAEFDKEENKIILDFAEETVTIKTPAQKGTEHYPGLLERKDAILAALDYEEVDLRPAVEAVEAYVNGEITEEEFKKRLPEA